MFFVFVNVLRFEACFFPARVPAYVPSELTALLLDWLLNYWSMVTLSISVFTFLTQCCFSSQMWSQGGSVLPVPQYEGWGNDLCSWNTLCITLSFNIVCLWTSLPAFCGQQYDITDPGIKQRVYYLKHTLCLPWQDAMRLYYVCTAPHCGHRWTE